MSLGRAGCRIVTRPFFSGRVGSGHETRKGGEQEREGKVGGGGGGALSRVYRG